MEKKIKYYEEETHKRFAQAQENMNDLRFERVDQEITAFQKELAEMGLESLKQTFVQIINKNNKNLSLQKNLKSLMNTFNQGDVLRTNGLLQDIDRLISNPMLNSELIPELLNATQTSYQRVKEQLIQAEEQFKTEIEALEKETMDTYDFEPLKSQLQGKLKLAEQRAYSPLIGPIQAFLVRIDENQQIITEIERIKKIEAEGKLKKANQELEISVKKFNTILRSLFPRVLNALETKRKELEQKLSTIQEQLQKEIQSIHEKLQTASDYEPIKQEVVIFKNKSDDTELFEYSRKAEELMEQIRFNVRLFLEINKGKKLVESENINAAFIQFEQIKEIFNKKVSDCFKKNQETIDALKNEIQNKQEQIKGKILTEIDQYKKILSEQLNFESVPKQIEEFQHRAQMANLQSLPEQILQLEQIVKKNEQLFAQFKLLQEKYATNSFSTTKEGIEKLIKVASGDKEHYFPKICSFMKEFEQKLVSEADESQKTIQNSLDQILNNEVKELKFTDAQNKIITLLHSAEKFGLVAIQDQLHKITDQLSIHIHFNGKLDQILDQQRKAELGKAKSLIDELDNEIQPKFDLLYKSFREKVDQTRNALQTDITKEWNAITEAIRPLSPLVETEKKYSDAIEPLKSLKIRADKIGVQLLIDQLNELIKKCNMFLMPTGGMFIPRKISRSTEMGMKDSSEVKTPSIQLPKEQPIDTAKPATPVKSTSSLTSRTPVGPIRCKNCGSTQPANSRICTICGKSLK